MAKYDMLGSCEQSLSLSLYFPSLHHSLSLYVSIPSLHPSSRLSMPPASGCIPVLLSLQSQQSASVILPLSLFLIVFFIFPLSLVLSLYIYIYIYPSISRRLPPFHFLSLCFPTQMSLNGQRSVEAGRSCFTIHLSLGHHVILIPLSVWDDQIKEL